METIKLNQFGLLPKNEATVVAINNVEFEVKKTIPYEQILNMIADNLTLVIGNRNFVSAALVEIVRALILIKYFTNIDLSILDEETIQPKALYEIYDTLIAFDIISITETAIDPSQLSFYYRTLEKTTESAIAYKNSFVGAMNALAEDAELKTKIFREAMATIEDPNQLQEAKKFIEIANK